MFFKRAMCHPRIFLIAFSELWRVESRVAVYFQRRVLVCGANLAVAISHFFFFFFGFQNALIFYYMLFIKTHVFSDL